MIDIFVKICYNFVSKIKNNSKSRESNLDLNLGLDCCPLIS